MPDTLETALRELRETPSAEFAADLDARVAAGFGHGRRGSPDFGAAPPPPRKPRRRLPSWLLPAGGFAVAATLCVTVVVGIAGQAGSDDSGGGGGAAATSADSEVQQESGAGGSTAAPQLLGRSPGGGAVPGRDRKVERSASVTLGVAPDEVESAAGDVSDLTARFGGYVQSSRVESDDDADFTLRVPVNRLDEAMAALARVGEVTERRQSTQDITGTFNQAKAAVDEARALRTSLLRRLAAADTDAETESLRAQLRDANARIAAAQVAVRQVDRRASFARVDVTVQARTAGEAAADQDDGSGWGVGAAWDDAQRVLEVAAGVAVIALALAIPVALLALLGVGGRRAAVSRARRRVLDTV